MSRIALITQSFPEEKSETASYVADLATALTGQGHDIHVITSAHTIIKPTCGRLTIHKILESWSVLEVPKFVKVFFEIKPDVIHFIYSSEFSIPTLISVITEMNKHLWKLPLITTVYDFHSSNLLQKLKSWPLFFSSHAITVPQETIKATINRILANKETEKIHVVSNGSSTSLFFQKSQGERTIWDLKSDDIVLGFVGDRNSQGSFNFFIKTVIPLLQQNRHLKILALNALSQLSSLEREEILRELEKKDLLSQVVFTGQIESEKLKKAQNACDLLIFLNDKPLEEFLSSKLRGALTSLAPCLTWARSKDYNEFNFKHGENIWLTNYKSATQLRNDLKLLIEDESLRHKLGDGAKTLRAQFSYDTLSNELSRIYSNLLSRRVLENLA